MAGQPEVDLVDRVEGLASQINGDSFGQRVRRRTVFLPEVPEAGHPPGGTLQHFFARHPSLGVIRHRSYDSHSTLLAS